MYKNYIFDLYGTLVDINTNEWNIGLWKKMAEFYAFYGAVYKPSELKEAYEDLCRKEEKKLKYDYPEIKVEKVFKKLFKLKGVSMDQKTCIIAGQFFRIISTKYIKLYDGVTEMLSLLKEKDKKIYLLSNAQYIFTKYEMDALGLTGWFDGILISSEESCRKPSQAFYDRLFERYGLKKEESVMIGNDWITDIRGAKEYGLATVYIHSNISPQNTVIDEVGADFMIEDGDVYKLKEVIR